MNLRAVAFDLSLRATGVAATHNHRGEPGPIARTVHTRRHVDKGVDHARIHQILVDLGAAVLCQPDIALMEGGYVGQDNNTLELAGIRAIVGHWLWARRTPYAVVAPATLKVYATGRGNTAGENAVTKEEVRERVTATYGHLVHVGDDNQADAVCLLAMCADHYGQPLAPVPESHRRALKAVRWPVLNPRPGGAADLTAAGPGTKARPA